MNNNNVAEITSLITGVPSFVPTKRQRQASPDASSALQQSPSSNAHDHSPTGTDSNEVSAVGSNTSKLSSVSSFRNVSACNRCRTRKNRCDQKLPSCTSCEKAGMSCVGYDHITKKEIPRSYIYYLETRVEELERILRDNSIAVPPAEDLTTCSHAKIPHPDLRSAVVESGQNKKGRTTQAGQSGIRGTRQTPGNMPPNIMNASNSRSLAAISGVSFARIVYAAVQHSTLDSNGSPAAGSTCVTNNDTLLSNSDAIQGTDTPSASMHDSFFGLHKQGKIKPAPFPSKHVGNQLAELYFQHANPQIPILHRIAFMQIFENAYAPSPVRSPHELYLLNMVFAIGGGVIVGESIKSQIKGSRLSVSPDAVTDQVQPEEYHASAIIHLETCLGNNSSLEVLQMVLLLANFALLRPVPPGLWYIVGVAMRIAVDLGLYNEDSSDDDILYQGDKNLTEDQARERGKRMYMRDLRRRLWWCTYSLERLVGTCVGRPFSISDLIITTPFPSAVDDLYITPDGFIRLPDNPGPSYKHVAVHYLKLRILQSEIAQVLHFNQTRAARTNLHDQDIRPQLPSPFLARFDTYRNWRIDIDHRLRIWKESAPTKEQTSVNFAIEFLELNYWQAIILLYRQSLCVPALFEGEYNPSHEVDSPTVKPNAATREELAGDEDRIYLKLAEAGQKILRIYRQIHLDGLVSYTYLSTHNLFVAGIAYLYAIWHSQIVRSRLKMDEVDFTVLAAKSVFTDFIDMCPPAETCRDAFDRTAKATIKMVNSEGGFGVTPQKRQRRHKQSRDWNSTGDEYVANPLLNPGQGSGFPFDNVVSAEPLPSPSRSVTSNLASPQFPRTAGFDERILSNAMSSPSQELPPMGCQAIIPQASMPTVSTLAPQATIQPQQPAGNSFISQQSFSLGSNIDQSAMDLEFLRFMPNSTLDIGMNQPQINLGFGLNWGAPDGLDYGDHQGQIQIFDNFFFNGHPPNQTQGSL